METPRLRVGQPISPEQFDAMPLRVTAADAEGRFVYANRVALAMLDLSLEEVVGRTVRDVLGDDMADRTTPMLARAWMVRPSSSIGTASEESSRSAIEWATASPDTPGSTIRN